MRSMEEFGGWCNDLIFESILGQIKAHSFTSNLEMKQVELNMDQVI